VPSVNPTRYTSPWLRSFPRMVPWFGGTVDPPITCTFCPMRNSLVMGVAPLSVGVVVPLALGVPFGCTWDKRTTSNFLHLGACLNTGVEAE